MQIKIVSHLWRSDAASKQLEYIYIYMYIYIVAIRTGYIFQAFSTAIASPVCIPYLGSPAALYINYISAGKINIFMNFLSAARIVVSPSAVAGGGWGKRTDRPTGKAGMGLAFMTGGTQSALQQRMRTHIGAKAQGPQK